MAITATEMGTAMGQGTFLLNISRYHSRPFVSFQAEWTFNVLRKTHLAGESEGFIADSRGLKRSDTPGLVEPSVHPEGVADIPLLPPLRGAHTRAKGPVVSARGRASTTGYCLETLRVSFQAERFLNVVFHYTPDSPLRPNFLLKHHL